MHIIIIHDIFCYARLISIKTNTYADVMPLNEFDSLARSILRFTANYVFLRDRTREGKKNERKRHTSDFNTPHELTVPKDSTQDNKAYSCTPVKQQLCNMYVQMCDEQTKREEKKKKINTAQSKSRA